MKATTVILLIVLGHSRDNVRSALPWQRSKRTGLLLSVPIDVYIFYIILTSMVHSLMKESGSRSRVKYTYALIMRGAVPTASVGPLCFVSNKVYQEILARHASSSDKIYGDAYFIFQ